MGNLILPILLCRRPIQMTFVKAKAYTASVGCFHLRRRRFSMRLNARKAMRLYFLAAISQATVSGRSAKRPNNAVVSFKIKLLIKPICDSF